MFKFMSVKPELFVVWIYEMIGLVVCITVVRILFLLSRMQIDTATRSQ